MARSLSSAASFLKALSETTSLLASRRAFSAAAAGSSAVKRGGSIEEKAVLRKKNTEAETAWVPDPVTGYYRPGNRSGEVDPAELREMLLSRRSQH